MGKSLSLRVELDGRIVGHVYPDVDVREATEVPDKGRPFQPPLVPLAMLADTPFVVKGEAALVGAALPLQASQRLFLVLLPEGLDQGYENPLEFLLLLISQPLYRDAGELGLGTMEFDRRLLGEL